MIPATVALLEQLAALRPVDSRPDGGGTRAAESFDVRAWLARHDIAIRREKPWIDGATVLELGVCPFNPTHARGEAAVILCANGMRLFTCQHQSCAGKQWRDVRARFDGPPPPRHARRVAMPVRPLAPMAEEPDSDEISLVALTGIAPASVRWLWQGRIPLGAVTLLVGDGGLGKSTMLLEIGARLTRGQLAGDLYGTPVGVAVATAEDAVAEVVRPRAEAADADLDLVHVVTVRRDGTPAGLLVPDDVSALRPVLRQHRVRLLGIDPLVAFLPETVNAHRDQDVRRALVPLVQLAEDGDLAVVAVVHLNKAESERVVTRINASVGFHNAARSVLLAGPDPADREGPMRVLTHPKCNLGEEQPALRFRIESRTVVAGDHTIKTSGVVWCGEAVGVSSADVLSKPEPEKESAIAEAVAWLRDALARGPVESTTLFKQAEKLGIGERTLQRARARLGATTKKESFSGAWVWSLPEEGDTQGTTLPTLSPLSPSSSLSPSSPSQDDNTPPRRQLSSEGDKGDGVRARAREGVHCEVDDYQRSTADPFGPTPPAWCGVCGGRTYHRAGSGWTCSTCHPPVQRAPGEEG